MNHSENIAKLSAALVRAQRNIGGAVKNTDNPFFRSKFASLGEVIAVCKAALLDENIAVSQMPCVLASGAPGLDTILLHESGEWISGTIPVICAKQNDPQALGSSYTYVRRYALQSALLIPAVDDDGEAAMYRQEQASGKQPMPVKRNDPPSNLPQTLKAYVQNVEAKNGTSKKSGKVYTIYTVTFLLDGDQRATATTFDERMAANARAFGECNAFVSASITPKEKGGFELLGMVEIAEAPLN